MIKTLPQKYEEAWFMEDVKEATRSWRSYTGEAKMDFEENDYKEKLAKFIEVEHSMDRCWSGIYSLKLKFPGLEPGDFVKGGTCCDCELKEDRLFIFRARVFHEWREEEYDLSFKSVKRDIPLTKNLYGELLTPVYEPPEEPVIEEDGGWVVNVQYSQDFETEDDPIVVTTTKRYKSKAPVEGFARIGVWDKSQTRVWSDTMKSTDEVPLNKWHTIETKMVGTTTGRGKIFIHCDEGFQGALYIDDVEVIWGGPTETERMVDKVVKACAIEHSSHADNMRIGLCDARDLGAVDWGGASDPYATVFVTRGNQGNTTEEEVLRSHVVYSDCFPVWNCDLIEVKKVRHGESRSNELRECVRRALTGYAGIFGCYISAINSDATPHAVNTTSHATRYARRSRPLPPSSPKLMRRRPRSTVATRPTRERQTTQWSTKKTGSESCAPKGCRYARRTRSRGRRRR